jgi:galactokinase
MPVTSARAPGRVNLIGDHTDYNAGLALPMAIDLGTTVAFTATGADRLDLFSAGYPSPASIPLETAGDRRAIQVLEPAWARVAAGVAAQVGMWQGGVVRVVSDIPVGAGLSSSAAFGVALALALGVELDATGMARLCQRAESFAGSEVGLMDPLVSMAGSAGHALRIDFSTLALSPVRLPAGVEVVVVHSGVRRELAGSPYAARRAECDAVSAALGYPVGQAGDADVAAILDPTLRRRARHVVTECARVKAMVGAFERDDVAEAGWLMDDSHRSLAEDFECSTPVVDELATTLRQTPGVHGARMTGGGFGGCVVALCAPGAVDVASPRWHGAAWRVQAADGARVCEPEP